MIVDSKGELPVALPHVSDDEDSGIPFGGSALREQKAISFSINVKTIYTPTAFKKNITVIIYFSFIFLICLILALLLHLDLIYMLVQCFCLLKYM